MDMNAFRKQHGLRALSFASAEELSSVMRLIPGAVTPLGILNDTERRVRFYLDSEFKENKIGVHPNDNTATVWMQADDLIRLVLEHGNAAEFAELLERGRLRIAGPLRSKADVLGGGLGRRGRKEKHRSCGSSDVFIWGKPGRRIRFTVL